MSKNLQRGPFSSIVRAVYFLIQGRIHFPKDRLGEIVGEGEDFEIFRHMTLEPSQDQPGKPGAIFKVRFQFASMAFPNFKFSQNSSIKINGIPQKGVNDEEKLKEFSIMAFSDDT